MPADEHFFPDSFSHFEVPASAIPEIRAPSGCNTKRSRAKTTHYQRPTMLESFLHRYFAPGSSPGKAANAPGKSGEQVSQETAFTREADVEGWVFLAEERHSEPGSKARSYADVVATGQT
ncbi:hypothetical protein PHYPSEUDO_011228 [Phytophthora pseudosyringae]|uniref:Uncharacterized protein n=1 Tax=Phytophthora pseudosyringae TaxID=221518 RepID=A0A8T1WMK8_9STRA|nr:hypothetical protein PHYPSEUDO_011228 [Phytophthora pseudosyringae]